MSKNMLERESCNALIARVAALRADSQALWGKMTATEMLHHCNKVHQQLLTPVQPGDKTTSLKQYLLRWLVLYLMPRYPKGAQTPKQFRTSGTIDQARFEEEKQTYIDWVNKFATHTAPIDHWHPYFGKLSTKQWGLASWKHADHHLRQFGV
jgi:hypothetical protein